MPIRKRILDVKTLRRVKGKEFTVWQQPVMQPKWYTMFCCDCALCHQFQFRIAHSPKGKPHVQFRVRRANSYTQLKRKHKSEQGHIARLKKGDCVRALVDNAMVITLVNGLRRGGAKTQRKKKRKSNG